MNTTSPDFGLSVALRARIDRQVVGPDAHMPGALEVSDQLAFAGARFDIARVWRQTPKKGVNRLARRRITVLFDPDKI